MYLYCGCNCIYDLWIWINLESSDLDLSHIRSVLQLWYLEKNNWAPTLDPPGPLRVTGVSKQFPTNITLGLVYEELQVRRYVQEVLSTPVEYYGNRTKTFY